MKLIKWGFDDEQASYAEESNISANQGGGGIKTERGERPTVRFLGLAKIRPETHQRLSLSEVCTHHRSLSLPPTFVQFLIIYSQR